MGIVNILTKIETKENTVMTEVGAMPSASASTAQVARWLESVEVKPHLERLVSEWNALELLGIDLADQIRQMAETSIKHPDPVIDFNDVNWAELAEHYASEICGVNEEELTRRRKRAETE